MSDLPKNQIRAIEFGRGLIDVETGILQNIRSNLNILIKSDIQGADPIYREALIAAWTSEIREIEFELIQRN